MNKLLGLSLLAALALAAGADPDEPLIQGKPLSDWVKELNDPAVGVRLTTVQKLAALGIQAQPAVPALVKALKDRSPALRQSVAQALQRIGPGAVTALAKALSAAEEGSELRGLLAQALGEIGPDAAPAVPALRKALEDSDTFVRHRAAYALGRIGPKAKAAAPALKDLLKDDNAYVRRAAEQALKQIGE